MYFISYKMLQLFTGRLRITAFYIMYLKARMFYNRVKKNIVFIKRINLFTGGRLKITPGVTLKFEHSIGMMIAGEIIAEGDLKGGK
jgi:hypothetical protein